MRSLFSKCFRIPYRIVALVLVVNGFQYFIAEGSLAQEQHNRLYRADSEIQRVTYSGNHWVGYPSLSDDGNVIVFQEEVRDTSMVTGEPRVKRIIKAITADGKNQQVLFTDSTVHAPVPYEDSFLLVGTKPPLVSGDGGTVIFALSLSSPADMKDHVMAVVKTDASEFQTITFTNEMLSSRNWNRENFESDSWARVANYAISDDGSLIACVVKGHFGPVAYGSLSGIVVVRSDGSEQRTLLAPRFENDRWTWNEFPRRPLTGGGWAFALTGAGETILFGAQSSDERTDYDLYTMKIDGSKPKRVTTVQDRLFSFADISADGERITFFYSGKKGEGIGTYVMNSDGTGLHRLTSHVVDRLDYDDVTDSGDKVYFKSVNGGFVFDINQSHEVLIFDRSTPGYVRSGVDMDFPSYPSFWAPDFVSRDGHTVVLVGVPVGKDLAELFVLTVGKLKKTLLICPSCGNRMDPSWKYCPYDGTKLE
ncbi:MAG: hypothetical protein JSV84_16435 [Gemmatimonadota bacterium]|nr:MAG: hypothetical protein JSV84_16435 [Gemmatimonadota bacterium]